MAYDPIINHMILTDTMDRRNNMKYTVMHRPGGTWFKGEVSRLVNNLTTEAYEHPEHPGYLILFGHYTKEDTIKAGAGGPAWTVKQVTGLYSEDLPFRPCTY